MRRLLAAALLLLLPRLAPGQTSVTVNTTDTIQSGCSLAAANATCVVPLRGKSSAGFVVTGTSSPTGITLSVEGSRDGTNWHARAFNDATTGACFTSIGNASLATGYGKAIVLGAGDRFVRVRNSAWTSGSVTVTVTGTDTPQATCSAVDSAWYTSGVVTATTLTQAIAAPSGTQSVWITGVVMSASVASTTTTDQQLRLKYGTGTNCGTGTGTVVECFAGANGGCALTFSPPIKVAAANAVCYMHAATGSKSFNVNYYVE
jgi:hypothetical protein